MLNKEKYALGKKIDLKKVLKFPETFQEPFYESRGQTLYHYRIKEQSYVIKTYQLMRTSQKIASFLHSSRAHRSYHNGLRLLRAGIRTPFPYCYLTGQFADKSQAALLTDFCGDTPLYDLIETERPLPDTFFWNLTSLFHKLLKAKMAHGDLHSQNLLVTQLGEISLIDLDGSSFHHRRDRAQSKVVKDRDRLLLSLPNPIFNNQFYNYLGKPYDGLSLLLSKNLSESRVSE